MVPREALADEGKARVRGQLHRLEGEMHVTHDRVVNALGAVDVVAHQVVEYWLNADTLDLMTQLQVGAS